MQPDNFRPIDHSALKSEFKLHPKMYLADLGIRYNIDYISTKYILILSTLELSQLFCYLNQKLHIPMWIKDKDYANHDEGTVSDGLNLRCLNSDSKPDYRQLLTTFQKLTDSNFSDLLGMFIIEPDKYFETGLHSEDKSIYAGIWINSDQVQLSDLQSAIVESSINYLIKLQKESEQKQLNLLKKQEADQKIGDVIDTIRHMSPNEKKRALSELIK